MKLSPTDCRMLRRTLNLNHNHELNRSIARRLRLPSIHDAINGRVGMASVINECARNGKVGLLVRQMDCDGGEWCSFVVLPATVMHVEREIMHAYERAEGPVSTRIDTPDEHAQGTFGHRDRALEAHENGHPHLLRF